MRALIAIILSVRLTSICGAVEFNPFDSPVPIAVFIQTDPQATVIGADTPRVAIYENGEVIFAKRVNGRQVYHRVLLDGARLENVRKQIRPLFGLKGLKPRYNIRPNVTDQPEAMFFLRDGDHKVATSVYGLAVAGTRLPAYTQSPGGGKPTVLPDELLELHRWFAEIDYPESKEWIPKYVEVMLWGYAYAPDTSIQWPKEWPSLNSDRMRKRGSDLYSIFLDGYLLPDLRKFLATRKEKGAVEIAGRKMAISYRFTFLGEGVWRKAFAAGGGR